MLKTVVLEFMGATLVLFTLRDVFHDIFHPTRSGSLSDFIGRLGSKFFLRTSLRPAIGPVSLDWEGVVAVSFQMV